MVKYGLSLLFSAAALWMMMEISYSNYSWWYWQNGGDGEIVLPFFIVCLLSLIIASVLRCLSKRSALRYYLDLILWIILIAGLYMGGGPQWPNILMGFISIVLLSYLGIHRCR
jgi:hypothetical protein